MQIIQIEEPFYAVHITYFLGGTVTELNSLLRGRFGDDYVDHEEGDALQSSVSSKAEGELFYVWIEDPDMNLLWHETMHLAFDILRQRGIRYADKCEDAFSYLGGNIFEKLFKKSLQLKKIMV